MNLGDRLTVTACRSRDGSGTTSDAELGGHGAFDAYHEYDLSYAGQTTAVQIVAQGRDGQTATNTDKLALLSEAEPER